MDKSGIMVATAKFHQMGAKSFDEIFDAEKYDTLRMITYSTSFDKIYDVAQRFAHTEIIFGASEVLTGKMPALIHAQKYSVNLVKKSKRFNELVEMEKEKRLNLYLLKEQVSHEKIYILSGASGKTLVVIGSANFTQRAFGKEQREFSVAFEDDIEAFKAMSLYFEESKANSSLELNVSKLNATTKEVTEKEIPILAYVEKEKIVTVEVPAVKVNFPQELQNFEPNFKMKLIDEMPSPKLKEGKASYSSSDIISAMNRIIIKTRKEKEAQQTYPQLIIDENKDDVFLNDISLKERAEKDSPNKTIKDDLINLQNYMDSFLSFPEGGQEAQSIVWKLICYSFSSPYITRLRRCADKNGYSIHCFPMYGIIYGEASTTKTSMTKVARTLMCGKTYSDFSFYTSNKFTTTELLGKIKAYQVGLPIFIQDLAGNQWNNHAGKILKRDSYELLNPNESPLVIITSNDISSLSKDLSKRCICFNPKTVVSPKDLILGTKKFNEFCNSFSPRLFLEFVHRMNKNVYEMEEEMERGSEDYFPDIFRLSSSVLRDICQESLGVIPQYMPELDFIKDIYSEEVVGKTKIQELEKYWITSKDFFSFHKDGRVFVDMNDIKIVEKMNNELPSKLCLGISGTSLILNQDELAKLGIEKPTIISKFKNLFS